MPHRDAFRFYDLLPVLRAQWVADMAEAIRFGMADLKDNNEAITAWERLIAIANSRPIFPADSSPGVQSEEEIVANFDADLWLVQMVNAGLMVPAHLLEQATADGQS